MPMTEDQKKVLHLRAEGFHDEQEKRNFMHQSRGYLISHVVINATMTVLVIVGIVYIFRFIHLMYPYIKDSSDSSYVMYPFIIFLAASGSLLLAIRRTIKSISILQHYLRIKQSAKDNSSRRNNC